MKKGRGVAEDGLVDGQAGELMQFDSARPQPTEARMCVPACVPDAMGCIMPCWIVAMNEMDMLFHQMLQQVMMMLSICLCCVAAT
jgi:hypothetical protein